MAIDFDKVKTLLVSEGDVKSIEQNGVILWTKNVSIGTFVKKIVNEDDTIDVYIRGTSAEDYTQYTGGYITGSSQNNANVSSVTIEEKCILPSSCENMFNNCSQIKTLNLKKFITANVTDMTSMFYGCSALGSIDLSNFDVRNVMSMENMFNGCYQLKALDLSNFLTTKLQRMTGMFKNCNWLETLNISNFVTRNVQSLTQLFYGCRSLLSLDLSSFDTSKANSMSEMFYDCNKLESLDLTNFNTSKVTIMNQMFQDCYALSELDLSNFDTSNVANMSEMFRGTNLTEIDLTSFNTKNLNNAESMFNNCSHVKTIDLSSFDTSNLIKTPFMFSNCQSLETIYVEDTWVLSSVTDSVKMFVGDTKLHNFNSSYVDKTKAIVDNGTNGGYLINKRGAIPTGTYKKIVENDDGTLSVYLRGTQIDGFTQYKSGTIAGTLANNQKVKEVIVDGRCLLPENVASMFAICNKLTSLDLSLFVTDNTTNMSDMFLNCTSLTEIKFGGNTSNATNMNSMFMYCSALEHIYVSEKWNTDNVSNSDTMFYACLKLHNFNLTIIDKTKAVIDNGENGGYLESL